MTNIRNSNIICCIAIAEAIKGALYWKSFGDIGNMLDFVGLVSKRCHLFNRWRYDNKSVWYIRCF